MNLISKPLDPTLCSCICHKETGAIHLMPCCHVCPVCEAHVIDDFYYGGVHFRHANYCKLDEQYDLTGVDISHPDIECNIRYSIYSGNEEKIIALSDLGIYYCHSEYDSLLQYERICFLNNIYVEDNKRGDGYGRLLVESCIKHAKRFLLPVVLEVDIMKEQQEGFDLISFYKNMGFELIENTSLNNKSNPKPKSESVIMVLDFKGN